MSLAYRKPRIPNLGQAIGLVVRAAENCGIREQEIGEDLRAFGAPSECYGPAYRNSRNEMAEAMDKVWELTGHPWWMVVQEAKARTGGRWLGWTFYSLGIPEARHFDEEEG